MLAKPQTAYPSVNWGHPLARLCLGAWNFQYPSGTVPDAMGYADAVADSGLSLFDWGGSPYGTAIVMPGTASGNFDISSSVLSRVTGASVSVSMLFNPGTIGSYECICDTGSGGSSRQISIFMANATTLFCNFGGSGSGGAEDSITPGLRANEWQHLLTTYRESRAPKYNHYIDGVLNGTLNTGGTTFNEAITLGSNPSTGGANFAGSYAHFAVYQGAIDDFARELGADPFAPFRLPDLTALWGSVTGAPAGITPAEIAAATQTQIHYIEQRLPVAVGF